MTSIFQFCITISEISHLIDHKKHKHYKQIYPQLETFPIVQHSDVTLTTNKTEPFKQSTQNVNYAELINNIKLSLPEQDDHT